MRLVTLPTSLISTFTDVRSPHQRISQSPRIPHKLRQQMSALRLFGFRHSPRICRQLPRTFATSPLLLTREIRPPSPSQVCQLSPYPSIECALPPSPSLVCATLQRLPTSLMTKPGYRHVYSPCIMVTRNAALVHKLIEQGTAGKNWPERTYWRGRNHAREIDRT